MGCKRDDPLRRADVADAASMSVDNLNNLNNLCFMSTTAKRVTPKGPRSGFARGHMSAKSASAAKGKDRLLAVLKAELAARRQKQNFAAREAYQLTKASEQRLRAIERGRRLMENDLTAAGGTLSTQEVADHLEISAQAVNKQRLAGKLLAVPDPQGHFRFPAFQFTNPQVRQHLQEVLRRLDEGSPFVKLNWLVNLDARLGAVPAELLARGKVEPVLQAADAFGRHVPG